MNDAPVDIGIVNNLSNPVRPILGTPLPVLGTVAFLDHKWSDKFTSSIGYSSVNIHNSEGQTPDAFRFGQYALVNLLYYPVKPVMMGGDFNGVLARTIRMATITMTTGFSSPSSTVSPSRWKSINSRGTAGVCVERLMTVRAREIQNSPTGSSACFLRLPRGV